MKISYGVKMTAQNDLGREYSVVQIVENENGEIQARNYLYTSAFKGNKGRLDCFKMIQKIKTL
jgi:hypothetical protein